MNRSKKIPVVAVHDDDMNAVNSELNVRRDRYHHWHPSEQAQLGLI
jgi:hypothetical protein